MSVLTRSKSVARKASARPARKPLSRDVILRAALEMIDANGIDSLSMRQLGQALGVEAMSIYHYFRNRDDLLDGVVEAVMQEIIDTVDKNHRRNHGWKTAARKFITAYRIVGNRHPNGFRLVAQRTLRTAAAKRVGQALTDAFAASGLNSEQAVIAYRAMTCFVAGFVLFETSGMTPAYTTGNVDLEFEKSLDILLAGIEECLPHSG
ncbi:TetR/AcrR family transcriptional regulator [Bradyrhizobium sp. TZ2]